MEMKDRLNNPNKKEYIFKYLREEVEYLTWKWNIW